ncbi:MAG TPA: DnaJ domain-containing protein [Terracidiphilus sp.]|nr:DnaJ domain-containing protein [Terracidiphilus sp.]
MQHLAVLGIVEPPRSKGAIHKAYRTAAKLWHPDRYENAPRKRLEAEEQFKRIHAAYLELCEHFENPKRRFVERQYRGADIQDTFDAERFSGVAAPPTIFFGDAHHCFSIAHFPEGVEKIIIASALGGAESPVGFVNMSGAIQDEEIPERYILLTNHRLFIRDSSELVHVLWYADLGEIAYIDRHAEKKQYLSYRLFGWLLDKERRYTLKIARRDGTKFYSLKDTPDDRVKKVIYNFLQQMRAKSQA